eukprot:TRINITY_DN57284_c0_g1_i2.p1 TRINITY_DN57284_c0_g1~~TRINITY_DN57284_c0_g1_i2.p1  ORF type:complete len:444 (+),score=40.50 TRINITY_DN57284_c0_g1_i2:41-1372(+)
MSHSPKLPVYDHYVFVDPPHYLKCVICQDVMKNPVSLPCGHSFCRLCVQQAMERKKECPVCRKEIIVSKDNQNGNPNAVTPQHPPPQNAGANQFPHFHPNIALCQALDEQLVYCRFGPRRKDFTALPVFEREKEGCTKILKRAEIPTHEKECHYRWVQCGLIDSLTERGCKTLCRACEVAEHQKDCDFRLVSCPNEGCQELISVCSTEKHKEMCLQEYIKCPHEGCSEFHLRKNMTSHQQNCPLRVVPCAFTKYGCQEKGTVAYIDEHVSKAINDHMMLLLNAVEYANARQTTEKKVYCPKKKFKCIINNFDRLAKKQVIDVDLDTSWKLKIWPNGEDKRHKGYVSIRLFSREACATFKVEGPYTLRIVNQTDNSKSIVKMTEATSREWADSVRGWGFPAFAKVDDVLDPEFGFVKDNKLMVEVEVMVQSVIEVVDYNEDETE